MEVETLTVESVFLRDLFRERKWDIFAPKLHAGRGPGFRSNKNPESWRNWAFISFYRDARDDVNGAAAASNIVFSFWCCDHPSSSGNASITRVRYGPV